MTDQATYLPGGRVADSAFLKALTLLANDFYISEPGKVLNVSREHFLIDIRDGEYILVDRGSSCGTLLEGEPVGNTKQGGWKTIENNDVIIVGSSASRFIFKFVIKKDS